ncbi:hypothetical protein RchiOBHm_Chr5g0010721 [Rosa chinensis]|uniref:Uncharacterized protein n=1 Tax=Rosa chinensis TaxID=74649 RepID=A0A2P6Q4S9_ROSCH|nr:hypothetical protein RchiOBHm_Chr5g0010721 [Rosa chinensis]
MKFLFDDRHSFICIHSIDCEVTSRFFVNVVEHCAVNDIYIYIYICFFFFFLTATAGFLPFCLQYETYVVVRSKSELMSQVEAVSRLFGNSFLDI